MLSKVEITDWEIIPEKGEKMAVGLLLNVSDVKPECHFVVAVAEILPTDSLSSSVLVMDETSDQMLLLRYYQQIHSPVQC